MSLAAEKGSRFSSSFPVEVSSRDTPRLKIETEMQRTYLAVYKTGHAPLRPNLLFLLPRRISRLLADDRAAR